MCVVYLRPMRSEVRASYGVEYTGEKYFEVGKFTLARKAAKYGVRRLYRKPTQVGDKKIVRRTG